MRLSPVPLIVLVALSLPGCAQPEPPVDGPFEQVVLENVYCTIEIP